MEKKTKRICGDKRYSTFLKRTLTCIQPAQHKDEHRAIDKYYWYNSLADLDASLLPTLKRRVSEKVK